MSDRASILVSRVSASAAEIVAGAMQDLDRAAIIGQRTYGKGLVQTTRPLPYNGQLKITTAKYYIPSGRCIQALDYSNRNEDGSVGHIPDSLISEFKTKNGRNVFDGGGIFPDIEMKPEPLSKITLSLYSKSLLFNYATEFASKISSIPPAREFIFSDSDYNDFLDYLKDKDYDYQTQCEEHLKELINSAKKEKYYSGAVNELEALQDKLKHDKDKDLQLFKDEIIELLTSEIAGRYYYQGGRIESTLKNDLQIQKAVDILNDSEYYFSILNISETKELDIIKAEAKAKAKVFPLRGIKGYSFLN